MKSTIEMPEDWQSPSERRSTASARRAEPAAARGAWATEAPPSSAVRSQARTRVGVDWLLIGTAAALVVFGLVMVYSSSVKFAAEMDKPVHFFLMRQSIWALLGTVVAVVLAFINYHYYRILTVWMMLATLALLLVVATFGDTTYGAIRSLVEGSVRPSELAKLVTILYVSVWLNAKRDVLNEISLGLIPLMAILGLTGGLILIQPDISAAATVLLLGCILFFVGGGEMRQIAMVMLAAGILGWAIVNVYPTGVDRITRYLAGLNNPLDASYHVQRALEAIINGGLFGVGIGHGSTKFTGLPVALTDSIFAVITEELGLIGAGVIISAYLVILWRGLSIAKNAEDQLGALIASGITIWIAIEAVINMAVMVNLLPHAGNALPFISYGGTHLLMTLAGIGILINIARMSNRSAKTGSGRAGGNAFGAVVDLRWRDRGRRVSRPGRTAGTR